MDPGAECHDNLALTEPTLFILLSLADRPKHGYAIMKDVQSLSEGRVVLGTGTLYGALKRLLEHGWIERIATKEADESQDGRPVRQRKAYALTRLGRRAMETEIGRLRRLISIAGLRTAGERI